MAEGKANPYGRPAKRSEPLTRSTSAARQALDDSRIRAGDAFTKRLTVDLNADLYKKMRRAFFFHDGGGGELVRAFIDGLPTSADGLAHVDVDGPWIKKLTADISPEQHRALKIYAFEHGSTIAAVMRDYVASLD